ncbi:epoxyqueuosine reductase [Candidatus Bathyarchaeota archaeon]|nr:epoxyqueuosine reductase [Candidatus Bathyarchaeota archaeon]MBS7630598.1 epoxyqueuosine reductase [Candidatus Bathyarchaeota archaeon]
MASGKGKASEEKVKLTRELKEYVKSYTPWQTSADLVGIIPVERLDEIPSIRQDWMNTSTIKTTEQMEDAKSVIVLGYHASDDIYEAIVRRGNGIEIFGYPPNDNVRKVLHYLKAKGFEAMIADDRLPKKQMARLAGFGNYGKNALLINPKYGPWVRLGAIVTDAEFVYDEPFERDLCGECEKCLKACPTGALTPFRVDYTRCLVNPTSEEWVRLISGELKYSDKVGDVKDIDKVFDIHSPRFTDNSRLMCTTCQRACPYGRKERGLEK